MQARLISSTDLAPEVRQFIFEAVGVGHLNFTPGQFVSITEEIPNETGDGHKNITRAYSLASKPDGSNRFELCLNRVGGGRMSPHLFTMQPGETIPMSQPLGTFVLRDHALDPDRHSIMIGTGTGIAPFRSMLSASLNVTTSNPPKFTLIFGVRHESHLLYRAEFEALEQQHPKFRFLPTVSRPTEHWNARTGHVQSHIQEALHGTSRHADPDPSAPFPHVNIDFYLCGLKPMIDDVRSMLKEMGFDRKQIRYEKYD